MAVAATRVKVCDVNQFTNRMLAVARDMRGDSLGDGDKAVVDDERAKVLPRERLLDDHVARIVFGERECRTDFFECLEADGDSFAVVGVERLDGQRKAQPPDSSF